MKTMLAHPEQIQFEFTHPETKQFYDDGIAQLEADGIIEQVSAANTAEELFEVLKDRVECTFEEFKAGYMKIQEEITKSLQDAVQSMRRELDEDELDIVTGGGFWSRVGSFFADIGHKFVNTVTGIAFAVGHGARGIGRGIVGFVTGNDRMMDNAKHDFALTGRAFENPEKYGLVH